MATLHTADLSIVSFIILLIIYVNAHKHSEKASIADRLFLGLIQLNMIMIIIDLFGWVFNGIHGQFYVVLNTSFNILLYILAPAAPLIWALYANYQINKDEGRLKKAARVLIVFFIANALVAMTSPLTGWFFSVSENNIYQRGAMFLLHVVFCYAILAGTFIYIMTNKTKLEKRYFYALLLFFLPATVGIIIQVLFYGVSYNWVGMMLSVMIVYFYVQNHGLNTDYLTGAYNRRLLDEYTKARIRNSTENSSFSAILLDLDGFKKINDTFGHNTGDEALKDAVKIIRQSLRENDFLARVGGDEFIVILNIDCPKVLERTIMRIKHNVLIFNQESAKPYRISFSIGSCTYDAKSHMDYDSFFKHVDFLMYEDKKNKQCGSEELQDRTTL